MQARHDSERCKYVINGSAGVGGRAEVNRIQASTGGDGQQWVFGCGAV